jgi:hypothetical protein
MKVFRGPRLITVTNSIKARDWAIRSQTSITKAVGPGSIDVTANAAKGKVSGMGAKRKPGRPRKVGRPKGPSKKEPGRPRKRSGGALITPGYSAGQ